MFNHVGQQAMEYIRDAQQRGILYMDVMRQSGDQYVEHANEGKPPVLVFDHEMIVDGRDLPNPVNYGLLRIVPPADMPTNPDARPFVIIDPRAGHGPGVAGSKVHSEIGVALAAGHPCYFVTFGPEPEPEQSIYCILMAEKHFLEVIIERHDYTKVGRPFLIGNCQGGWALMMLASVAPKLVGPIMLAGAPLSYWSGASGQNPMRYAGGMLGGSWTSSLAADLGHGIFDGVNLVENFERLDPANTFWKKPYRLYSQIDTEVERYLGFEKWWAGHFSMTRKEIDWITQNLFIGNKLARAELPDPTSNGNINMRNIRSPIIVFASKADNITPPSQALNWIPDMYASDEDLRAHEQVIVYSLHESTGHLGIFVSSGIASREHEALTGALDLVELLPPGLYEARIEDLHPNTPHQEWIKGRHVVTFEPRKIKDLEDLDDGREEEADFEVVNRISKINQHAYDLSLSPIIRSLSNSWTGKASRQLNPRRLSHYIWSSMNPVALAIQPLAEQVKAERQPVAKDNIFLAAEQAMSEVIVTGLDTWRDMRDRSIETLFHSVYGNTWLRAMVGLGEPKLDNRRGLLHSDSALHEELYELRLELTRAQVDQGGAAEAFARILIYMAGEETFVDERAFNLIKNLISSHENEGYLIPDLATVKRQLRQQWRIVSMHPEEAIAALPKLVPNQEQRAGIWRTVEAIAGLKDILHTDEQTHQRYAEIACALQLCSPWGPPEAITAKIQLEQAQQVQQEIALEADKDAALAETKKALAAQAEQTAAAESKAAAAEAELKELKAKTVAVAEARAKSVTEATTSIPVAKKAIKATKKSAKKAAKKAAQKAAKKATTAKKK